MDSELGRFVSLLELDEVVGGNVSEIDSAEAEALAVITSRLLWNIIEAAEEDRLIITEDRRREIFDIIDIHYQLVSKCGGTEAMRKQRMSPAAERDGFKRVVEFNSRLQLGENPQQVVEDVMIKYPSELQTKL